jgi:hypothetical protein
MVRSREYGFKAECGSESMEKLQRLELSKGYVELLKEAEELR